MNRIFFEIILRTHKRNMSTETALLQINEVHRTNCSVEKMKSKKVAAKKSLLQNTNYQNHRKLKSPEPEPKSRRKIIFKLNYAETVHRNPL